MNNSITFNFKQLLPNSSKNTCKMRLTLNIKKTINLFINVIDFKIVEFECWTAKVYASVQTATVKHFIHVFRPSYNPLSFTSPTNSIIDAYDTYMSFSMQGNVVIYR